MSAQLGWQHVSWVLCYSGLPLQHHCVCVWLCRDRERLEAKYREQLDALTSRAGDLDTENRQLRGLKYELDTKVQQSH